MKIIGKTIIQVLPKVIKASPMVFTLCILIEIIHATSFGLTTIANQYLLDSATQMAVGNQGLGIVFGALILFGLINIIKQVFNALGNFLPDVLLQQVRGRLTKDIQIKISKLNALQFEDTDILDDINKAELGKEQAIFLSFMVIMLVCFYMFYIVFMGGYLYSLKPELVWAIVLIFIPIIFSQIFRTKVFAKLEDVSASLRREQGYYEGCIVNRETFKETRLLGGFYYFKDLYLQTLCTANKLKFKSEFKTALAELVMKGFTILGYVGVYYMLFDALMKQEISIGAFAAVINSVGMIYAIIEEIVCRHMGKFAQSLGSIQNYLNFMALEEEGGEITQLPKQGDIELKNVYFKYPNSEKVVLSDINLVLRQGETLAVVGENGSGKSTLMRLLTGIYHPVKGEVTYAKINLKEVSPRKRFKHISSVFQKYQKYQLTFKENIIMSELDKNIDLNFIDAITLSAGISKEDERFIEGYDTMLSREFGGIDLSGGQWQRVAIARGLYKCHELIILDEPTAAIDPLEETRLYKKFAEITKWKTGVIVTHRIGSAKIADRIAVMKDGKLVEVGTHEALIAQEGEYMRLYRAQEQWYTAREENVIQVREQAAI